MLEHQASLRSFEIVPSLNIFSIFYCFLATGDPSDGLHPYHATFIFRRVSELPARNFPIRNSANPVQVYRFNPYVSHNFMSDGFNNDCQIHSI